MFAGDERRASTDSEVSNASTELELQGSLSPHEERPHPTKGPTSKLAPLAQGSAQRVSPLGGRTLESVPETPPEAAMFSGGSMAFASEITQRNAAAAAESALWGRPRAVAKAAGEGATRSEGGAKGGETREVHRQNREPRAAHSHSVSIPCSHDPLAQPHLRTPNHTLTTP